MKIEHNVFLYKYLYNVKKNTSNYNYSVILLDNGSTL